MLDWITHIWHKSLGSWNLLDILGIVTLIPVTILLLWVLAFFVFRVVSSIATSMNNGAAKSVDEQRKKLGYDK
jgi:uncharacterized protein involved in cysteine biosynthesis